MVPAIGGSSASAGPTASATAATAPAPADRRLRRRPGDGTRRSPAPPTAAAGRGASAAPAARARLGTVHFSLTDAPACGYDAVNVTVERCACTPATAPATPTPAGPRWFSAPPKRFDLLDLTNGVLADLGPTPLPAGKYTQMRLVLADNGGANPFANSVCRRGGSGDRADDAERPAERHQAQCRHRRRCGPDADFVLDFDACKSVVRRGNSGAVQPEAGDLGDCRSLGGRDCASSATSRRAIAACVDHRSRCRPPACRSGRRRPRHRHASCCTRCRAGTYDLVVTSPAA